MGSAKPSSQYHFSRSMSLPSRGHPTARPRLYTSAAERGAPRLLDVLIQRCQEPARTEFDSSASGPSEQAADTALIPRYEEIIALPDVDSLPQTRSGACGHKRRRSSSGEPSDRCGFAPTPWWYAQPSDTTLAFRGNGSRAAFNVHNPSTLLEDERWDQSEGENDHLDISPGSRGQIQGDVDDNPKPLAEGFSPPLPALPRYLSIGGADDEIPSSTNISSLSLGSPTWAPASEGEGWSIVTTPNSDLSQFYCISDEEEISC